MAPETLAIRCRWPVTTETPSLRRVGYVVHVSEGLAVG